MAMLAGLVHDIGTLAILRLAESHQAVLDDPQELDNVLDVLSPRLGCMVLQAWHFPPDLIDVPRPLRDFGSDRENPPPYAVVVRFSFLQRAAGPHSPSPSIDRA